MVKKDEESEEEDEDEGGLEEELEEGADAIGEFVEGRMQNPDILNIGDLVLQSGEQLPQILEAGQLDNLEVSLAGVPTEGEGEEQEQNVVYEGVESRLYEETERRQERQRNRDAVVDIRRLDRNPMIDMGNIGLGGFVESDLERAGMIRTSDMGNSESEIYETREKSEEQEMPWEGGGDERVKKYKRR